MQMQRQYSLVGNDELAQLSSAFIRFIEEILLPIAKQDTKQFQSWTKFKEIIDPFNKKIDISRVDQFLSTNQNSKQNQENKPPLSALPMQKDIKSANSDKIRTMPSESVNQTEQSISLINILDRVTKTFQNNNTHLDILLKMNESTCIPKQHHDNSAGKPQTQGLTSVGSFRRLEIKRRNTEFYHIKPMQALS